jgi:hypothetical protein
MAGDPLRDLDGAPRIHVFGNARCTKAVTTNSFQDPAGLRAFLDQLQNAPTIQTSLFDRFTILAERVEHLDLRPGESVQAKDRPLLSPSSAPVLRVLSLVFLGTVTSACRHVRSNRLPSG